MLAVVALFCIAITTTAQVRMPQPSPTQTVKQDFGMGSIELTYSRPNAKGRKIYGDLVPYNKLWRTGANGATKIVFTDPVELGGKKVDTGTYVLYTIPGVDSWEIILNKGLKNWGIDGYKESEDVARINVKANKLPFSVESFLILFEDMKASSMNVTILWDNVFVAIPVTTEVESKVMSQIDQQMKGDKPPYFMAAYYYLENGKDLNKAVEWFDKAIAENPKAFWIYHQKAQALAKLGKKADAVATATKSMEIAKTANNPDYVALNEKLIASMK